jgi:2'-5' RNA ligase
MAFIGLRVPPDAARLLESHEVPGERLSASDMHVTILYIGKGVPVVELAKAMVASYGVATRTGPLSLSIDRATNFPVGNDGWPIICRLESAELQQLNADLRAEFTRLGLPFNNKWPIYKPHVTLSYLKEPQPEGFAFESLLPGPLPFTVHELTIWGGDDGDGRIHVNIPFVLSPAQRMASRVASRRVRSVPQGP